MAGLYGADLEKQLKKLGVEESPYNISRWVTKGLVEPPQRAARPHYKATGFKKYRNKSKANPEATIRPKNPPKEKRNARGQTGVYSDTALVQIVGIHALQRMQGSPKKFSYAFMRRIQTKTSEIFAPVTSKHPFMWWTQEALSEGVADGRKDMFLISPELDRPMQTYICATEKARIGTCYATPAKVIICWKQERSEHPIYKEPILQWRFHSIITEELGEDKTDCLLTAVIHDGGELELNQEDFAKVEKYYPAKHASNP